LVRNVKMKGSDAKHSKWTAQYRSKKTSGSYGRVKRRYVQVDGTQGTKESNDK